MYRLYEYPPSGNSYKIKLTLEQLGLPYETVYLDITKGASRTPEFLQKNPNGKIPVLELEDGRCLSESHAILWYLADDTELVPADRWQRAKINQWLCFEQHNMDPGIGTPRFWLKSRGQSPEELGEKLTEQLAIGRAALSLLDAELAGKEFLVGNVYSIADISLYGYTHVADEAGFDLDDYPAIQAWIGRIEEQPGFIPMDIMKKS